jgi:protein SCO1/2
MKSALSTLCFILGFALFGVAAYYFVFIRPLDNTPPPVISTVENFKLIDTEGAEFTSDKLAGKIWVADLVFTSCKMTCPILTRKMKNIYLSYELEDKVRFVSISVDPERDTPDVLKKYSADNGINNAKWYFLTGEMDEIRNLATKSLKLASSEKDANLHSDRFVLIDGKSRVRGYYDPKDKQSLKKLFHELALVLNEENTHDS